MNPKKAINNLILNLEKAEVIKRTPGIIRDYHSDYVIFNELEANYEVIKKECEALLTVKDKILDIGSTGGPIRDFYKIKWKSFMFKAGSFIEDNCALCPETARMLKKIPRIKQAFFSILDANQYIKPHHGYYNGFLRYHLGLIIPENNENQKCWLRVNDNPDDNERNDKESMGRGDKYFWKSGEGIMFNDNYLHDAANESNEVRVVLYIDVVRKFPFWLDLPHRLLINTAYKTSKQLKKIEESAKVDISKDELKMV